MANISDGNFTHYIKSQSVNLHVTTKQYMLPCLKFNYAFSFLQKLFVDHSDKTKKDFQKFMTDMSSELIEDVNEVDRAIDLLLNFFKKSRKFKCIWSKAKVDHCES